MEFFKIFLENTAGLHGLLLDLAENIVTIRDNVDLWLMAADAFEDIGEELLAKLFRLNGKITADVTKGRYKTNYTDAKEKEVLLRNLENREFDGYSFKNTFISSYHMQSADHDIDAIISSANMPFYGVDYYNKKWFKYDGSWTEINRVQIPFGLVLIYILKESAWI